MSNIETKNLYNKLNLFQNLPLGMFNKISNQMFSSYNDEIEVIIISGSESSALSKEISELGGKYDDLGFGFGIVDIKVIDLVNLVQSKNIQYIEIPKSLYSSDLESNKAACVPELQTVGELDGEGVLVGFIDSGIDFTHRAFRNDDGTTRIEYIYDLSGERVIYPKSKINEALASNSPYTIVNAPDLTKHGTHVAGIACAGGQIPKQYYGVAPKSSIIMVRATKGAVTLSTQIMRGLKFLVDKSKELQMPLVVNISLSTNDGAHNGSSLLEQYISTIAKLERITIVIAAGNEGEAAHHVGGLLTSNVEKYINVGKDEVNVAINLYKSILPKASMVITSPTGATSKEINLEEGFEKGLLGDDSYNIIISGPKPFDVIGEITLYLNGIGKYITAGRWKISIKRKDNYNGRYDMWLPISEGLNVSTKFFEPTITNTIGIPATVENIISVGSYNYSTNTISPYSGRGVMTEYNPIKPDLVAPGENIYSTITNNSFDKKSGTSMAAPHVTGICALFSQWGIVKNNDVYLYGDRIKYFLINGARRDRIDIEYPDPSWGYGTVCAYDSFKFLNNVLKSISFRKIDNSDELEEDVAYREYKKGKLFIRLPL